MPSLYPKSDNFPKPDCFAFDFAKEVYTWLENSMNPDEAAHKAITLFDQRVDIGLIILTRNEFASNARNGMPWSHITERKV